MTKIFKDKKFEEFEDKGYNAILISDVNNTVKIICIGKVYITNERH